MKASKTENWFTTTETRFAKKNGINIPACYGRSVRSISS